MARRKVTMSFTDDQFADLQALMREDKQDNFTFYGVFLIQQEKKRREVERSKVGRGRPKQEVTETLYYPCPYDENIYPYTMSELEGYYALRKEEVPKDLKPLTKEELRKFDL